MVTGETGANCEFAVIDIIGNRFDSVSTVYRGRYTVNEAEGRVNVQSSASAPVLGQALGF
jgi:hypothetical protein